jgi:hypothetical protein
MRALCIFALALSAACSTPASGDGCKSDSECDGGQFCDAGVCKCRTNDQCGAGQYCNAYGTCQVRPACLGNEDCPTGLICNSAARSGGDCIPAAQCGSPVQCPLGHFCEVPAGSPTGLCRPGCRDTGDCILGQVCIGGDCDDASTTTDCVTCPAHPNPDASYCDYGEKCTFEGDCVAVPTRAGLCDRCDFGSPNSCDSGLVCLTDNDGADGVNYCSPICTTVADCPNGFNDSCGHVILVGGGCNNDNDCFATGGRCVGGAETSQKFCTYGDASACAGTGLCFSGRCFDSGMPCTSATAAVDCGLTFVPIEQGATDGVCETNVGVCGKISGLTCERFDSEPATCRSLAE